MDDDHSTTGVGHTLDDLIEAASSPALDVLPLTSLSEFINFVFPSFEALAEAGPTLKEHRLNLENAIESAQLSSNSSKALKSQFIYEFTRLKASFHSGALSELQKVKQICSSLAEAAEMATAMSSAMPPSILNNASSPKNDTHLDSLMNSTLGSKLHDDLDLFDNDPDELEGNKLLTVTDSVPGIQNYLRNNLSAMLSNESITSPLPMLSYKRTSITTVQHDFYEPPGAFNLERSSLSEELDEDDNHSDIKHSEQDDDQFSPYRKENSISVTDFSQIYSINRLQLKLKRLLGVGTAAISLQDFENLKNQILKIDMILNNGMQITDVIEDISEEKMILLYNQMVNYLEEFNSQVDFFLNPDIHNNNAKTNNEADVVEIDLPGSSAWDEHPEEIAENENEETELPHFNKLATTALDIALYAVQTCKLVHDIIKTHFMKAVSQDLNDLKWPKPISTIPTELQKIVLPLLSKHIVELVRLQVTDLSLSTIIDKIYSKKDFRDNLNYNDDNKQHSSLSLNGERELNQNFVLYPISCLLRIPIIQFKFHFDSDRPTNRLDKPEWALKQLTKLFDDHFDFLSGFIEECFIKGGYFKENPILEKVKHVPFIDARSQFMAGMIMTLRKKLVNDLDVLMTHPQLLTLTISALVSFDIKLVKEYGYKGALTSVSEYLDNSKVFNSWISMLKISFEEKLEEGINSEDAFDLAFPDFSTTETSILTKVADLFITLQEALTEQYKLLDTSKIDRKVVMFTEVELPTLESFVKHIVTLKKDVKLSAYTINARGSNALQLLDRNSLILYCRYCSSLYVAKNCLMDKDEIDLYIELWSYIENVTSANNKTIKSRSLYNLYKLDNENALFNEEDIDATSFGIVQNAIFRAQTRLFDKDFWTETDEELEENISFGNNIGNSLELGGKSLFTDDGNETDEGYDNEELSEEDESVFNDELWEEDEFLSNETFNEKNDDIKIDSQDIEPETVDIEKQLSSLNIDGWSLDNESSILNEKIDSDVNGWDAPKLEINDLVDDLSTNNESNIPIISKDESTNKKKPIKSKFKKNLKEKNHKKTTKRIASEKVKNVEDMKEDYNNNKKLEIPPSAFTEIISIYDEHVRKMEESISHYIYELAVFSLKDCLLRTNWVVSSSSKKTSNDHKSASNNKAGISNSAKHDTNIPVPEIYPLLELFNNVLPILKKNLPLPSFHRIINQIINEKLDKYILENIINRSSFNHEGAQHLRISLQQWLIGKILIKFISDTDFAFGINNMLKSSIDSLYNV